MESHPQNPEFRNNPDTFHPCIRARARDFSVLISPASCEGSCKFEHMHSVLLDWPICNTCGGNMLTWSLSEVFDAAAASCASFFNNAALFSFSGP